MHSLLVLEYLCAQTTTLWGVPEHDVCARVCACVGQTLLSYARGFPRGPKTYTHRQSKASFSDGWRVYLYVLLEMFPNLPSD